MKIGGIYGIKCTGNARWYIGQAAYIQNRWLDHKRKLRENRHYNIPLQRAYNKYGHDSFEYVILEVVSHEMRDAREIAWIGYYSSMITQKGFNLCTGGNANKVLSTETRAKISACRIGTIPWNKGKKMTEEYRNKVSESHKYRIVPEESKKRMSRSGMKHTAEARAKMSLKRGGVKIPEEVKEKMSQARKKWWTMKRQFDPSYKMLVKNERN